MNSPRLTDEQWHKIRQTIEAGGGTITLEWWVRRGVELALEKALAVPSKLDATREAIPLIEAADAAAEQLLTAISGLEKHPTRLMALLGLPTKGHLPTLQAALDEKLRQLKSPLLRIRDFADPNGERSRLRTKPRGTRGRDIDPVINTMARTLMAQLRRRCAMPLVDKKGDSSTFVIMILVDLMAIAKCGCRANPRQTAQRTVKRLLTMTRTWPEPEMPPPHWFDPNPYDGSNSPTLN